MVGGSSRRRVSRVDSGLLEIVVERVDWVSRSWRVVNGADAWPPRTAGLPELREERKLRTASCGSTVAPLAVVVLNAALLYKVSLRIQAVMILSGAITSGTIIGRAKAKHSNDR